MMYKLPDSLRPALTAPFGPIHDSGEAVRKVKGRIVVAVGDVVTQTFLDGAVLPKLMVIDGVTQRGAKVEGALENLPKIGVKRVTVNNPPATITQQLIAAIDAGLKGKGSTVIDVKGEEDLAALPAMIVAPDGAAVCYGQPDRGVVIVIITPEVRRRATEILQKMDVK